MNIKKYKDKNGQDRWKFRVYLGTDPKTGKRKSTNRQGFTSLTQAKIVYRDLVANGLEKTPCKIKFKDVVDEWLYNYKDSVKDSTYMRTEDAFRLHILPVLGDYYVRHINHQILQEWVKNKATEIVKYKEYANYISNVLDYAVSVDYCDKNYMKDIKFPKKIAKKTKTVDTIWNKEELKEFLDLVEVEKSYKWYAFFRLLAYTGMRRGEIIALEWSDLKGNMLTISKSRKREKSGEVTGDTKTSTIRQILIDDATLKILHKWKKEQFRLYGRLDIMFNNKFGSYILLNHPIKVLHSVTDKHNLRRIDIHRFRHIHTSMLIYANKNQNSLGAIMDRLGREDIRTTLNIYNHIIGDNKEEVLDEFIKYLA